MGDDGGCFSFQLVARIRKVSAPCQPQLHAGLAPREVCGELRIFVKESMTGRWSSY